MRWPREQEEREPRRQAWRTSPLNCWSEAGEVYPETERATGGGEVRTHDRSVMIALRLRVALLHLKCSWGTWESEGGKLSLGPVRSRSEWWSCNGRLHRMIGAEPTQKRAGSEEISTSGTGSSFETFCFFGRRVPGAGKGGRLEGVGICFCSNRMEDQL